MPLTACVLFVRNEYSDIAGWVAWHLGLGIDRLIVFDDHSTDGTWDVIQAAAQVGPVDAQRSDMTLPNAHLRRQAAWRAAVDHLRNDVDWIGFLDADEYLDLGEHESAGAFFGQPCFADGEAIAFSGCLFGGNGHALRPRDMAPAAFTRRGDMEVRENRLGKSFVRPAALPTGTIDAHRLDIPDERYRSASGDVPAWDGREMPADWRHGRILRYGCRSVQHTIDRLADMPVTPARWAQQRVERDRNDHADDGATRGLERARPFFETILMRCLDVACMRLAAMGRPPANDAPVPRIDPLPDRDDARDAAEVTRKPWPDGVRVVGIRAATGPTLRLSPDRTVTTGHGDASDLPPVYGVIQGSTPQFVTLFAADEGPVRLSGDSVAPGNPLLRIVNAANEHVGLMTITPPRFVAAPPAGAGDIAADRLVCSGWEHFTLVPTIGPDAVPSLIDLPTPRDPAGLSEAELCVWLGAHASLPSFDDRQRALAMLSPVARHRVQALVPALLFAFL